MLNQKLEFSAIDWEDSPSKARSKTIIRGNRKIRLLEIPRDVNHPDWCETGHIGLVLEGELEIEFVEGALIYREGDGILISSGVAEKHKPKPRSKKVVLFLVEEV